ncbi:uncharacterized protein LOC143742433 isoform X2 [Siphateles boraxobius]
MASIKEESEEMRIEEVFSVKQENTEEQTKMSLIKEESEDLKIEETFSVKQEDTEEQTENYEETTPKITEAEAHSEEERKMRKVYLEGLFASLDADFQAGSFTEEWADTSLSQQESVAQMNLQDEGMVMSADDSDENDERNATYVLEDGGDNDEDGDINHSAQLIFQEQSAAEDEHSKVPRMGKPCGPICRKKCSTKITEDQRRRIFTGYWNMSYSEKKSFIFHMVSQRQTMRHTSAVPSRRTRSLSYHLNNDLGQQQEVCKTTFLTTLGYHPKNDRLVATVIGNTISSSITPPQERRGRHTPSNKIDMAPIFKHIESFNPTSSHYRRENAPHRRYLPSDVSIQLMYKDYKEKKSPKCSYETYRKAVKERKISFTKLGEEECETCLRQDVHFRAEHPGEASIQECHHCEKWEEHKKRAERGRHHYRLDAERQELDNLSIRSVDLQKVIMLPRMPGVKTAVFTKRITAFHETFVSVGKNSFSKKNSLSVIWHEGIAGRKAEEVASAFLRALNQERDVKHIIYWVDSCTAQNKNWCLLTTLVTVVNDPTTPLEDVTLKYFEPGHTFMSADSFHHGVEKEMRKRPGGAVLDFEDFKNVIACSNSRKVNVVEMQSRHILAWRAGHSLAKLQKAPNLSIMAVIQLRRGSREMFFKLSHDEEEYTKLDFLLEK